MTSATMAPPSMARLDNLPSFDLPSGLEATVPPEGRGLTRDGVRMLVAHRRDGRLVHAQFGDLPRFLEAGDLVVINTSGTLPAAVPAIGPDGAALEVHLSTELPAGLWSLELRRDGAPMLGAQAGQSVTLPAGGRADLLCPLVRHPAGVRLWVASLSLPQPLHPYLAAHGHAIRYRYVRGSWPLSAYQNVYATEPGSAEMPSAGRPFTTELITRLVAKGVAVTPLVLHTGVASPEAGEPPYPERYRVPAETARRVNVTRGDGGRVIAVGTTVVRALETLVDGQGRAHPGEGWTELVVTPERGVRVVDGLLTGWHEPEASHLAMLEAVAGRDLLERSYAAGLAEGYLWHEFGDVHLVLP
jgi:S-adenosylmethionine:tRNA ribosyltransferase-isomerase